MKKDDSTNEEKTLVAAPCIGNQVDEAEALLLGHMSCMIDMKSSSVESVRENQERFDHQLQSIVKVKGEVIANISKQKTNIVDTCNTMDLIVCPDTESFNTVFLGWTKQKSFSRRADDLLVKLKQLHELVDEFDGPSDLLPKPSAKSYGIVLGGLARSGAAERAEEILSHMENTGIKPNAHCYVACINAWANSKFRLAHKKAETLIKKMIKEEIPVEKIAYTSLMNCYKAAAEEDNSAAQRCEEVLNKMIKLSNSSEGKYSGLTPDSIAYTTAIEAWARSNDNEAASRIDKLLHAMIDNDNNPDPSAKTFR